MKKTDGRRNNRGGPKSGRPSRAKELKIIEIGNEAIISEYGSIQDYWNFIAKQSRESFPHLKLLNEYIYGKPRETKDLNIRGMNDIFKGIDLDVE